MKHKIIIFAKLFILFQFKVVELFGIGFGNSNGISLYEPIKDDIELLNKTNFNEVIYSSNKAFFVEFYAHWCGTCQRYARHWKELAKETKPWHSKIIRVAAINCGDSFNDEICREHKIEYYPTLKLFPPNPKFDSVNHDGQLVKTDNTQALIREMIIFLEQLPQKPLKWPDLEPFTSKMLENLFSTNNEIGLGFLIFEKSDSYLGRKLILDFSLYNNRVILRYVNKETNSGLYNKFQIEEKSLPVVYVIYNDKDQNYKFEKFDENLVTKSVNSYNLNAEKNEQKDKQSLIEDDDLENLEIPENLNDERAKYFKLIRKFIKINDLLTEDEFNELNEHAKAGQVHADEVKKQDSDIYLNTMENRIYMQDLESGLSIMLRSEIPKVQLINGDKMSALKEWVRVLSKYFPGRKSIKSFLKQLNTKINSSQITEITGTQWKSLLEENKLQAVLREDIEWKHCKGSMEKYRGYPCSLWTIFHVLTVSQVEIEKNKLHPFEQNFDVKEVILAIRSYVKYYFGCKECSENFIEETQDYQRYLSKPHDAIQYLWIVHNKVNKRLANDQLSENDPLHPKKLFPTQDQCPKCYLPSIQNIDKLADHESPWVLNEVLLFLSAFYSKYQIQDKESVESLNRRSVNEDNSTNSKNHKSKHDSERTEKKVIEDDLIKNIQDNDGENITSQKSFDFKIMFFFFIVIILSFTIMYTLFNPLRRKGKLKKHII